MSVTKYITAVLLVAIAVGNAHAFSVTDPINIPPAWSVSIVDLGSTFKIQMETFGTNVKWLGFGVNQLNYSDMYNAEIYLLQPLPTLTVTQHFSTMPGPPPLIATLGYGPDPNVYLLASETTVNADGGVTASIVRTKADYDGAGQLLDFTAAQTTPMNVIWAFSTVQGFEYHGDKNRGDLESVYLFQ
ncbi:hypothetical protein BJ742DRAFT_787176 [Cladochytrium replicatum]|nr:hypothetical protein BJ742DRAFT_787176 [Cladochytrium replicatum]